MHMRATEGESERERERETERERERDRQRVRERGREREQDIFSRLYTFSQASAYSEMMTFPPACLIRAASSSRDTL